MQTKQTIAIIGATGNMGSAIARKLANGNYRLLLKSTSHEKLEQLVDSIKKETAGADVEAIPCPKDAGWESDIVILAVPYSAEREIAERIREVVNQKIIISIANPLNETFDGLLTAAGTSAAEELQKLLPTSQVVKAFNTTFAASFSRPAIDGRRADAFIAGDNEEAVTTVSELVATAGFRPVHAGKLEASRILENMQLLMIQLNRKYNYNWQSGWKILHDQPAG